jgi:two-component system OmpR family response regulator/two-component system response regulator QseB
MNLLLVDRDGAGSAAILAGLMREGLKVERVTTATRALGALWERAHDVVLLDPAVTDTDGEPLICRLRAQYRDMPIVVLSERPQVKATIGLLDLGADDCLPKSVDPGELCARLRALQRRMVHPPTQRTGSCLGPLELNALARTVRWYGKAVALTDKEFDVLKILMLRRPRVVSRAQLEDSLYGWTQDIASNSVEVYIHYLRRKLAPTLISTIRGEGYTIAADWAEASASPPALHLV